MQQKTTVPVCYIYDTTNTQVECKQDADIDTSTSFKPKDSWGTYMLTLSSSLL